MAPAGGWDASGFKEAIVGISAPSVLGGTAYVLRHNQNVLSRLDPTTGKPRGEPLRLEGINDFIFSSPVGAAGRIYVTGRDGATVVLRHDRENKALAVNRLEDSFSASAAVAGREFYLRGERFLVLYRRAGVAPCRTAMSDWTCRLRAISQESAVGEAAKRHKRLKKTALSKQMPIWHLAHQEVNYNGAAAPCNSFVLCLMRLFAANMRRLFHDSAD